MGSIERKVMTNVFIEERVSIENHYCTRCHAEIHPNDNYTRKAIPPWAWDGVSWYVDKICSECL